MFAKNVVTLMQLITKNGEVDLNLSDEVIRDTLAAKDGQVQNSRLRDMLNLGPLALPPGQPAPEHLAQE
jgi:hypothetical protein